MNAAEKKVLSVAFALFVVGVTVRFLPWGLPSIEQMEEPSYTAIPHAVSPDPNITNKIINTALSGEDSVPPPELKVDADPSKKEKSSRKKGKKRKKKQNVVRLPIHINSAGIDELCALKGVGPKLAEKIIEVRDALGGFSSPSDLEKVPGIGKKKAEGILQGVIFD